MPPFRGVIVPQAGLQRHPKVTLDRPLWLGEDDAIEAVSGGGMTAHEDGIATRLEPLFRPAAIAVIGASARRDRPGFNTILAARLYGFEGPIYPITPRYGEVEGLPCFASIAEAPGPVDLAIIAGAAARVPEQLEQAVAAGARAAVVFATLSREADGGPSPLERIAGLAREAAMPLLGSGSIGYVNYAASTAGLWVPPDPGHLDRGAIALIVQSGSTYGYCNNLDPRLRFCFTAHPGQEAGVSSAEILDYVLEMPETRVVGLYLETMREPERFARALERASGKGVAMVVMKPGRTQRAATAIATHAGRLAGDDAIYDALFRRHGAIRAATMDEFYATLVLFSKVGRIGPGGLAAVTDSGGQRSVLLDAAEQAGLALTELREETRSRLRQVLSPELPDDNPVDLWGGEENLVEHVERCVRIVADDPGTAIAAVVTEFGVSSVNDAFVRDMGEATIAASKSCGKPVVAMTFSSRHFTPAVIRRLDEAGVAVLDGIGAGVAALAHLTAHRDRQARDAVPQPPMLTRAQRAALAPLVEAAVNGGEAPALALLAAAGIPVVRSIGAQTEDEVADAVRRIAGPVALKTAMGHDHKSDVGGVVLALADEAAAVAAWRTMADRLGPKVVVAAMADTGVEVALGALGGTQFGPAVMVAAGGTLVELIGDTAFELAPLSVETAAAMLARTRIARLLAGHRGAAPCDAGAVVDALVRLSQLIGAFADEIDEVDVNPLIVTPTGCIAVDAVVRGRERAKDRR
jgi:acyl-CoA synthetase (NDP forming)